MAASNTFPDPGASPIRLRAPCNAPGSAAPTLQSGTQSIRRIVEIVRMIASYNAYGLRLVEIATHLRLARPTIHRLLKCMVSEGWLMHDPVLRRYFLGHELFELGLTASLRFRFGEICQPSLRRIARKTGHVAFLTIRSGMDAISISRSQGPSFDISALQIGVHRPLGVGAGSLALLMLMPDDEIQRIVSSNARRLGNFSDMTTLRLLELVKLSQQRGYAMHDSHLIEGVSGVGVPVMDGADMVLGAISISSLQDSLSQPELEQILEVLKKEAKTIHQLMKRSDSYDRVFISTTQPRA